MAVPTRYSEKDISTKGVKKHGESGRSMAERHNDNHPLSRITETMWKRHMHDFFSMKGGDDKWNAWVKIAGSEFMRVLVVDDTSHEPIFWVPALKYTYSTKIGDNVLVMVDQIGMYSRVHPAKSEAMKEAVKNVIVGDKPSKLDVLQIGWIARRYGLGGVAVDPATTLAGQSMTVTLASSSDVEGQDEEW